MVQSSVRWEKLPALESSLTIKYQLTLNNPEMLTFGNSEVALPYFSTRPLFRLLPDTLLFHSSVANLNSPLKNDVKTINNYAKTKHCLKK